MNKHSPANQLFDICVTLLLGSMALYGAVLVLQSIWLSLCIALAVVVTGWLLIQWWLRRW